MYWVITVHALAQNLRIIRNNHARIFVIVIPHPLIYSSSRSRMEHGTAVPSWSCSKAVYKPV